MRTLIIRLFNLCSIVFLTACEQCDPVAPDVLGCMDSTSPNYNAKATKSDGSCISCAAQTTNYVSSFNTFLSNGSPVANFRLDQEHSSYNVACNKPSGGPVKLTITSTAPVPLRFSYVLRGFGATGLNVWTYSGTVNRLAPGAVHIEPQVVQTPVRVDVGAGVVFTSVVQVP